MDTAQTSNNSENLETLLIQKSLQGDEEAFVELYHRYVSPLYGFVYQKVSNVQDAEDITAETFLQALKDLPKFSHRSTFKNWLYGIAKHLILAHYRQKYQEPTVELEENIIGEKDLEDEDVSAELAQKGDELKKILGALPEKYRQVLELRFLKGYTILETADTLGISEENAKVLQHRAIKKARINSPNFAFNTPQETHVENQKL